jgi:hypothetical protein
MTRTIGTCSIGLAILLASSSASGQTDIEKIRARVKTGQKVSITDDEGQEVKGRISAMTADALTILGDGKSADVPYGRIVRIDRPNDSLANGALMDSASAQHWDSQQSPPKKTANASQEAGIVATRQRAPMRQARWCSAG